MNEARLTIWGDDACRRAHEATLRGARRDGHRGALRAGGRDLRRAPARSVDGTRVRIPAELVEAAIKSAPRGWSAEAARRRRPSRSCWTPRHSYCGTGSDVLYICDPDTRERRRVVKADVEGQAALCEKLPNIDFVMSMGLPEDVPQAIDDLAQVDAMVRGTRKPLLVAPRDGHILGRMKEMCALAGEADSFGIYAMPVPPLMFDEDGASKVMACAELDVPMIWAPAPNAGTTAPASIASVIVVANAETLAGLVLSQAVKPGAPFVWGVGVGAMNMRTMNEVYASAGPIQGYQAQTDLARWYDLPSFSYAAHSDSKSLDGQWGAEAAITPSPACSRARRCCTTSATSRQGCRAATSRSCSATSSSATPRRSWRRCGRRRRAGAGGDRGGRAGRQPPGPAVHAQALPRDLAERPASTPRATPTGWRKARRPWSTACGRASAALRAEPRAFELGDDVKAGLDRILAEVEASRPTA